MSNIFILYLCLSTFLSIFLPEKVFSEETHKAVSCTESTSVGDFVIEDFSEMIQKREEPLKASEVFGDQKSGIILNFTKGHLKLLVKDGDKMFNLNGYPLARAVTRECSDSTIKGYFIALEGVDKEKLKSLVKVVKRNGSFFSFFMSCAQAACSSLQEADILFENQSAFDRSKNNILVSKSFSKAIQCLAKDQFNGFKSYRIGRTEPISIQNFKSQSKNKDGLYGNIFAAGLLNASLSLILGATEGEFRPHAFTTLFISTHVGSTVHGKTHD